MGFHLCCHGDDSLACKNLTLYLVLILSKEFYLPSTREVGARILKCFFGTHLLLPVSCSICFLPDEIVRDTVGVILIFLDGLDLIVHYYSRNKLICRLHVVLFNVIEFIFVVV